MPAGTPTTYLKPETTRTPSRHCQVTTQNLCPATHLQVAPGFRLSRTIDAAADEGVGKNFTDDYHHFCMGYHLKGVCNSNYGGRH